MQQLDVSLLLYVLHILVEVSQALHHFIYHSPFIHTLGFFSLQHVDNVLLDSLLSLQESFS